MIRLSRAALCVAACFGGAASANAAPTLPKVVAGQASFSQDGKVFSITNTPGTIINWHSFSVNAGEITRFIQQNGDSAVLNRITGQDPSRILGALQSNGKVFLINPNGVVFGAGARVDVNGLVASTLDMSDADFLAGKNNFSAGPAAGSVRNEGAITTPTGGKVFLVAPDVENSGVITAPNGEVVLAAGRSVQLVDSGNPDLAVVVSAPGERAVNLGQVVSQGGRIGIYGALVNQRGVLNADSAVLGKDGRIVLKASKDTVLEQGSVTSALGTASGSKGGEIHLLGERVSLAGNAQVDASGAAQGGTVLVGGDYQGKQQNGRAALPNAQQTVFGKDARIRADASAGGDGGTVVLWSSGATAAHGSISARGAGAGKGGLIETSGRQLDIGGLRVDAGGGKSGGRTGTWLIDPTNIVIAEGGTALDTTYISASTLTATNADIVLQASNNLSIEQAISTPHSVRAEAGNELTVAAAVTSTGGDIDLRANGRITLLAGGSLSSPNYIDLRSDKMTLAGAIGGVAGILPVVSFNTFTNTETYGILLRGSEVTWALGLNPSYLGTIGAYEINIGNSAHQGPISIDQPLTMAGNLVIDTSGSININAAVRLTGPDSQFLGTLHKSFGSAVQVSNMGLIEATKKISLLGADQVQIQGALLSRDIDISAASGGIQLRHNPNDGTAPTTNLVASGTLRLRSEGELTQENNASVQASALLIEGNLIQMPGANRAGTLAGNLTASAGGALRFNYTGDLSIGSVAGVSGLHSTGELSLTGNSLRIDAGIGALMADIDADAITGSGTVKANALFLTSRGGIGASGSPLHTSAGMLNAVNTASGSAPINILNDRVLVLADVVQAGSGNAGAISIETTGGLTVAATPDGRQGIKTGSGDISLVTHSPLLVEGKITTDSGNVTLLADNNGALTISGTGLVSSASGNVRLTGGEVSYPAGSVVVADPDKLAVTRTAPAPIPEPEPEPVPPLDTCLSNPATSGCGPVIEQATRICIGDPDVPSCAKVLPSVDTCRIDPDKLGCTVVMQREEIRQCIANPKAPGCSAVLPPYSVCEQSPTTFGCAPVIAEHDAIAQCIANPKAPGCATTLPPYSVCEKSPTVFGCAPVIAARDAITACIAAPDGPGCAITLPAYEVCAVSPNTYGCAPVIARRDAITACIATPTAPGCAATLPSLEVCRANAGLYGCAPVIARAEFLACVANPAGAGCAERLPTLSFCKAMPGAEGCAQVLQLTFDACLVNKNDPSCVGILPTLSQCVANQTMPGCAVVLPTLQQCVASPTLQGCGVILPKLEQCLVNPNQAGCAVVLPKPDFCSTNPRDPSCVVFKPTPTEGAGESKRVVAVQQNTVNLINTRTPAQEKLPAAAGTSDGAANGGKGGAGGGSTPSEQSEKQSGPAAGTHTGVENEKPASKMYCN